MSVEPTPPAPPKEPKTAAHPKPAKPAEAKPNPEAAARKVGSRSTEKRPKAGSTAGAAAPAASATPAAPAASPATSPDAPKPDPAAAARKVGSRSTEKRPKAGSTPDAAAPAPDKADKADDKGKKKGTTSRPGAKKPGRPPRSSSAGTLGLVVLCVAGLLGAGGGVYLATRDPEPDPAPPPVVASPPISLAPRTETAPPEPEPAPPPRATGQDPTEEVENLLAAGRERAAMDLLVEKRPAKEVSARLRARILEQSKETLEKTAPTLRALVEKGQDPEQRLTRLRMRLPASMEGDVDALAAELRAVANLAALKREKTAEAGATPELSDEDEEPIPVGPLAGRPRRPGQPEPRPESPPEPEPSAPEPSRPEPRPEPASEPAPTRPEPTPEPGPAASSGEPADDTDKIISDALKERLHAHHSVHDGVMDVSYQFSDTGEAQDFQGRGWDKFEINKVNGVADGHLSGPVDLELGAGSRGLGVLTHVVDLAGDFEIDVTLWTAVSGQLSEVVLLCGKQVGVRWGGQLVQVKKGGGVKPLGPETDRICYKAESEVSVKMIRRGDTLEVKLNGTRVAQRAFKPGELDGPFGLFAGNVRIVITSLRIKGKVDARKL
jgi:hypothetical protein